MSIDSRHRDDRVRWVRWRARRLLSAGFPADLAERLARADRIDLHRLLSLVDRRPRSSASAASTAASC
jgi:hypothetical protein